MTTTESTSTELVASSVWTSLFGVPFAQRYYDAAGVRTRVLEAGTPGNPVLVFLHGVNGHAEAYVRNLEAHAQDFHVFSIDMIGHGLTDRPVDVVYETDTYVEHLAAFLDAVGAESAHLSGESLGGWVSAKFALKYPHRVRRLVLNTPGGMQADPAVMAKLRELTLDAVTSPTREKVRARINWLFHRASDVPDDLVETRFRIYSQPGYREVTERTLCLQDMEVRLRNLLTEAELQQIAVPTLLVFTAHDPMQGVEVGERCARLIPNSELVVLEDSAHWPQFEEPDLFNDVHLAFLRGR
jgi:2-hydroxy-6-oxonona-2,4-dienedioate hydrolase